MIWIKLVHAVTSNPPHRSLSLCLTLSVIVSHSLVLVSAAMAL